MRTYLFIVLCCFVSGYYSQALTFPDPTESSDLPMIVGEEEISNDGHGYCTFNVK